MASSASSRVRVGTLATASKRCAPPSSSRTAVVVSRGGVRRRVHDLIAVGVEQQHRLHAVVVRGAAQRLDNRRRRADERQPTDGRADNKHRPKERAVGVWQNGRRVLKREKATTM